MADPVMTVRCLASTKIAEQTRQEEDELDENGHDLQVASDDGDEQEATSRDCGSPSRQDEEAIPEEDHTEIDQESPSSPSAASSSSTDTDISSDSDSSAGSTLDLKVRYTSCIQEAQLSPDGTCIFTSDYSRTFSVYPVDTDILSETGTRALMPYAQFTSTNPTWAFAVNPLFNVQDAHSTTVLVSRRDSYITLHNALWDMTRSYDAGYSHSPKSSPVDISKPLASYKLVDSLTEAIIAPMSLAYSHDGAYFFAGKKTGIATFDLEHSNGPVHTIRTIPSKRNKLKGGGRGFKGLLSALSLSPPTASPNGGLLAAGARTRHVGIYNSVSGQEVTAFSLPGTVNGRRIRNENLQHIIGDGVSHIKWSPCGRYLYVAERQSDALLIYDVRNFSLSLGHCAGRKALTKQKLGFDIWNAGASPYEVEAISHEIWAGGTDGNVRIWRDPYKKEGAVEADEVVRFQDEDIPVSATLVHSSGSLVVAASGVVEVGDQVRPEGVRRGGGTRPRYNEWGCLDIFGLV